ncbi:MAG: RuvX/YqgF family protein [Firmicutes bacterium]|nr:RuvX/YqgF family protein [Bacillota bacterium]
MNSPVLAIDPGTDKCGLAVVDRERVLRRWVAPRIQLLREVGSALGCYQLNLIVLGDRTGSARFRRELAQAFPHVDIVAVDEHLSSVEARQRYWQENPPRGWRRFIPLGMQVPPEPFDDLVAVILAERYFRRQPVN